MDLKKYLNNLTIEEIEELFQDNILNISDIVDELRKENQQQQQKEDKELPENNII